MRKLALGAFLACTAVILLRLSYDGASAERPVGRAGAAAAENGDVNGDGNLDVSDSIYLLLHLFSGGPEPVACALPEGASSCVDRMADLRDLPPGASSCVQLLGYHAAGDGGGGTFFWDAQSNEPDDGGTVIEAAGTPATGRWRRLDSGPISVKWFGAAGDGQTLDDEPLRAALAAGRAKRPIVLPAGIYIVSRTLDITLCDLRGSGVPQFRSELGTIIRVTSDTDVEGQISAVLRAENNGFSLRGLAIDARRRADHGLHTLRTHRLARVRDVAVTGALVSGFYFEMTMVASFENLSAERNGDEVEDGKPGDGFWIEDCNASRFVQLQALSNEGHGVVVSARKASGGAMLVGGNVEANGGNAVEVHDTSTSTVVSGYWIENNGDGVLLEGAHLVTVENCRISTHVWSPEAPQDARAVRLTNGSDDCVFLANSAARSNVNFPLEYASIAVEPGSSNNVFAGNNRLPPYGPLPVPADCCR